MFLPPGMVPPMLAQQMQRRYPLPEGEFGAPKDQTFYNLLQLPVTAKESDIRKAYRDLSRKHHPDKGGDTVFYQKLNEAQSVLSDPEKRACYDAYGLEYEKVPNLALFIQDLRPDPLEITLRLSTADCIKGTQTTVPYQRTKFWVGTRPQSVSSILLVDVPVNVPHGHRLVFPGQGNVEKDKVLPGHLVVIVEEQPPRSPEKQCKRVGGSDGVVLFKRKIPLEEALCGLSVALELPDGSSTSFTQAVIRPDQWYLVEGTVVPMYVMFDLVFPSELSSEQHEQLRAVFGVTSVPEPPQTRTQLVEVAREVLERKAQEARQRADEVVTQQQRESGGGGPPVPECRTQ